MACRGIGLSWAAAAFGLALLGAAAQAQVAGYTPGEFSVDPSGAATYQISLKVPAGAAGMQPELALLYHSRAGNGQLGVGWSLSGLSAISRCPAFRDQEGVTHDGGVTLSPADRFCLDGQPLRRQSGTYGANGVVYFTEVQSFQRVTSHGTINGAPTHFSVTGKDGLTRFYGNSTDSRILSVGVTSGVPIVWALNRIEDKLGNFITFSYGFDATLGEYWPSEIRWSNNASTVLGRVAFVYSTTRSDKTFGYAYGRTRQSLTRRLDHIQVYEGQSNAVRRYVLTYLSSTGGGTLAGSPRSYLYTVQECAGLGTPCLPATELLRDVGWRGVDSISPPTIAGGFGNIKWLDVNGDGRMDGVAESSGSLRIYFAKSNGNYVTASLGGQAGNLAVPRAVVLDYNGDGRMDLLVPNNFTGYWNLLRSTGTTMVLETTPHLHYDAHKNDKQPVAFDLTGNGIPELFFFNNNKLWFYRGADGGGFVPGAVTTGYTIRPGQRFYPLQFNGDGRPDLMISMDDCTAYTPPPPPPDCPPGQSCEINFLPTGGETLAAVSTNFCHESAGVFRWDPAVPQNAGLTGPYHPGAQGLKKLRLLDFDGDGLTDVVGLNGSGNVQVYLNRGGHFEALLPTVPPGPNWDKAIVFDYNLDDREDVLIHQSSGTFQLLTFVNNAVATTSTSISSQNTSYVVADHNGDGLPDFLVYNGNNWRRWPHRGRKEGLLVRVRNGVGDELSIRYAALSGSTPGYTLYEGHLTSDAATNSPRVRDFQGPIFVVENFAADTGISTPGGLPEKVVTQYRYAGAKLNAYGRGFLGFRRVTAHNLNTGIETQNVHFQEFPYTGMIAAVTRKVPNVTTIEFVEPPVCPPMPAECTVPPPIETTIPGPVISETANTVDSKLLGTTGIGRVRFPFVQSATELDYEFTTGSSALIKRTETQFSYDNNGNPTQITASIKDGAGGDAHTISTTNTWTHTDACPSRLTQSTVSQTVPSAGSHGLLNMQRVATFTYATATHCQLTSETSHAGTPAALTTTYAYDSFGNRRTETVTGAGISPARTTTTVYDAKGRYPSTITNAAGHTLTINEWHEGFGVRKRVTDANGLVTQWEIDPFGRETKVIGQRANQAISTAYAFCTGATCEHPEAVLKVTRTGGGTSSEQSLTVTELDRLGRTVAAGERNVKGQVVYALTFYDAVGRPYANSGPYRPGLDPGACWTLRHYDLLDRVRREYAAALPGHCMSLSAPPPGAVPGGWSLTQTTYSGLTTTVTDPEGYQRQRIVNVMGRMRFARELQDSTWRQTEFRYDAAGNTTRVIDPGGVITTTVFDSAGRKTSMTDPNMGNWSYAYNAAGELTSQTDAKSTTVSMTYDVLGRIKTRVEPEGTTTFTYDNTAQGAARGQVTEISGPHGYVERYWYDTTGGEVSAAGRYIDDRWHWTHYDYNTLGQVSRIRYPSVNCAVPCTTVPSEANRLRVDQYYAYGHLYLVRERKPDGTTGTRYWEALEVDALGAVTREKLGNNLFTQRYVNPASGRVETILTGTSTNPASLQDLAMEWDRVGSLTRRIDQKVNRREDFTYDGLGRLESITLKTAAGGVLGAESVAYGPSGNISSKGSYTNYQYQPARPHAVSAVTTPGGVRNYSYDLNGNLLQVTGPAARSVTWWSFNKPRRMERDANNHAEYWYGPGGDRAVFRQSARVAGQLELTLYGGALYERRIIGAAVTHLHYIQANGATVATVHRQGTDVTDTNRYLHKDHLGSVVAITSQAGVLEERLAYDAWGKRRNATTWQSSAPGVFIAAIALTRGFTMHEHLDQVGLVHMGGRVYDPEIGRFLSPDPFVQHPASTQGFNRYAYVGNNPLSYTDPSGYFSLKSLFKTAVIVAASYYSGGLATGILKSAVLGGAIGGAVGGYLATGTAQGAMLGALAGGVAGGIGGIEGISNPIRASMHGITQGAISKAGGGRFGDGALGAFASSLGGNAIARVGPGVRQAMVAAAVGGTASVIGGGKFANGAIAGAMVNIFNHQGGHRSSRWDSTIEEVPGSMSRRLEEAYEVVGQFTDMRHVPLMDDLGISEVPAVRLPGIRIGIGAVVTAGNLLYFSDYEVTFSIHKTTTVEVTRVHTVLRTQSSGNTVYGGPIESRREIAVSFRTVVSGSRYIGWSGVGRVDLSKITQPQCIAYGASC